ncbi:MAG: phosphoribosyltransferase [Gammaproteobacteria bacterium]|jgi:ATP phosphoribosyltransferase|nr:phosphoribosyltransferase [Gammaproteobacteria bacterium]
MQHLKNLRFVMQKSGRLAEGTIALLQKCGYGVKINKRQLLLQEKSGIDFLFTRDDDIPGFLAKNICDLGVFGENLLTEYSLTHKDDAHNLQVIMPLGFSKCRLSIAAPETHTYPTAQTLQNKIIATSYPQTLAHFLKQNNVTAEIVTMHGSVELAPKIGIADLICDLVSSGVTLKENGLVEVMKIADSQAVLVANKTALHTEKHSLIENMLLRINGVLDAKQNKYIMLHVQKDKIEAVKKILPSREAPTILELQGIPNKVAIHTVSPEEIFWETIEKLKEIGASSILVLPIEKMMA